MLFVNRFEDDDNIDLLFGTSSPKKVCSVGESNNDLIKIQSTKDMYSTKKAPLILPAVETSTSKTNAGEEIENEPFDPLDPDRIISTLYHLVHKNDENNCPLSVKRCNSCKLLFQSHDVVLVKTKGTREWTDKKGMKKVSNGNIYLHYLRKCLTDHDRKFQFTNVIVLKATSNNLPESAVEKFKSKGLKFE